MGSTRCQAGVNQGSNRGQPGVNLGSTWGQPGVNLGSTWGQHAPAYLQIRGLLTRPHPLRERLASDTPHRLVVVPILHLGGPHLAPNVACHLPLKQVQQLLPRHSSRVQRRKLKLNAKLESSLPYFRFKRSVPGPFNRWQGGSLSPPHTP